MAGHGNERIDVLRKGGIVIALVGGMTLLHSFGTLGGPGFDPTAMLALGFVVLASYTFGELVGVVKLPHITGYLLAGFLLGSSAADLMGTILTDGPAIFGPWFGLDTVAYLQQILPDHLPAPFDHGVLHGEYDVTNADGSTTTVASIPDQLSIFNSLAIALIAMTAGGELKLSALRKGLRTIMGVLFGQTIAILVVVTLFVFAISGLFVDWIALPFSGSHGAGDGAAVAQAGAALGQLSFAGVLCMGGLVATISIATSPAATIAVINSVRAKGAMTETVLSAVVLKDVVVVLLFAIIAAVGSAVIAPESLQPLQDATAHVTEQIERATSAAHPASAVQPETSTTPVSAATPSVDAHGDDSSPKGFRELVFYLLKHIGLALVLGVGLGLGIALYLKYVGVEIVLFLVGVVFTVTFAANAAQIDVTLLFIAAGFAATNFSHEGDQLIHELERLGVPVYVVFFTLTGAALHIDTLIELLPFALALVAVRTFGIWGGIRLGTTVMGAPESVKKHAWLGFISQAGVAIVLAKIVEGQFGQTGATISSLIIAGVAIHEVIGPISLKVALGLSGEIPTPDADATPQPVPRREHDHDEAGPSDLAWTAPPGAPDPWGEPTHLESDRLTHIADELRADLRGFVRDLHAGQLQRWSTQADDYLKGLRKEFLRHHRRTGVHLQEAAPDLALKIRAEQAKIADRWRDIVLARSSDIQDDDWTPEALCTVVDDLIATLPERVPAVYEAHTLAGQETDTLILSAARATFRAWHRAASLMSQDPPTRQVRVQDLARYHLGGLLPGRLEGLAALLIAGEQHLNARTRSMFQNIIDGYDVLVQAAEDEDDDIASLLSTQRIDVESEFRLARSEVNNIHQDAAHRAEMILGGSMRDFSDELVFFNTLDLPAFRRRYSGVFAQRTKGLHTLKHGVATCRRADAAMYDGLALELELVKLEGQIKDLVEDHGDQLARNVRGKGSTQVNRVVLALRDALLGIRSLLQDHTLGPAALATNLRASCDSLDHVAEDAARAASRLREELADEDTLAPLLDALLLAAQGLTEHYTVPLTAPATGEWKLPPAAPTVEVPFREVVISYIETSITRDLLELTRGLTADVDKMAVALDEFERVVAFNVELATGELELLPGDTVPEGTRDLVRDMMIGNLTRSQGRLEHQLQSSEGWGDRAERGVSHAVLGALDRLRSQVQEGQVSQLRVRILREAAAGRRMVRRAGGLHGLGSEISSALDELAEAIIGPSGMRQVMRFLGIRVARDQSRPTPAIFAEAPSQTSLPLVYRRLFSAVTMEAGDVLTGRRTELVQARRVLDGEIGGRFRSVALVGPAGVGKGALVAAVIRKVNTRDIERIQLTGPVSPDDVAQWFKDTRTDRLYVLDGFEWLCTMDTSGMESLRRFTEGLVHDGGANRWLVYADSPLWSFANRVAALDDAVAQVIELSPLSATALQGAILTRHSMSGYDLRIEGDPGLIRQLSASLQSRDDQKVTREHAWFQALHAATGGLLDDALRLWMAAIRHIDDDEGVVVIGDIPRSMLAELRKLPDEDLLTLRQIARVGTMNCETHTWLFRTSLTNTEAHLAHLEHLGLLAHDEHGYTLREHLRGSVSRVFDERGWTQ